MGYGELIFCTTIESEADLAGSVGAGWFELQLTRINRQAKSRFLFMMVKFLCF
jgi:hypothetical protein